MSVVFYKLIVAQDKRNKRKENVSRGKKGCHFFSCVDL